MAKSKRKMSNTNRYFHNAIKDYDILGPSDKVNGSHLLAYMLDNYYHTLETIEGKYIHIRNSIVYVNILLNPFFRYVLSVRLAKEEKDILLKQEFKTFKEAVAEAVVLSAKHPDDQPADVRHEINSCKLAHLYYDEINKVTMWKDIDAPIDKIVAELCIKLKDGL